ncbi:MAG: hypothetical protein NVS1B10_06040 [Candidatus Saccharimonadales bacterium]
MTVYSVDKESVIGELIKPSWLSALIAILIGLLLSAGVIVAFQAHNSPIQQQLIVWQQNKPQPELTLPDQVLPENNRPSIKGSWPLLIVWSLIGLLVYTISTMIVRSFIRAKETEESLDYVNAQKSVLIKSTLEHLLLRAIAFAILIVQIMVFWKIVIPYSITAAHASASDLISISGIVYVFLAFLVNLVVIHAITICIRLTAGKSRLFSV